MGDERRQLEADREASYIRWLAKGFGKLLHDLPIAVKETYVAGHHAGLLVEQERHETKLTALETKLQALQEDFSRKKDQLDRVDDLNNRLLGRNRSLQKDLTHVQKQLKASERSDRREPHSHDHKRTRNHSPVPRKPATDHGKGGEPVLEAREAEAKDEVKLVPAVPAPAPAPAPITEDVVATVPEPVADPVVVKDEPKSPKETTKTPKPEDEAGPSFLRTTPAPFKAKERVSPVKAAADSNTRTAIVVPPQTTAATPSSKESDDEAAASTRPAKKAKKAPAAPNSKPLNKRERETLARLKKKAKEAKQAQQAKQKVVISDSESESESESESDS